jgi:hypothetical protein
MPRAQRTAGSLRAADASQLAIGYWERDPHRDKATRTVVPGPRRAG